jgi:cytochrome d ubiquinol oxidase subunit I
MGVVSGIVMAYQFGTNWSFFSEYAGAVTGPLMAYEVLTAFFLEAGFLGVMLFGWTRVGPGLHFFATCMVALGTLISATWILGANSWMQTPQGYAIVGNRMVPVDWLKIVFNPSFPYRLVHMSIAAFLSTALFVGASAAWQLLRGKGNEAVRTMLSMAMWMLLIVAPIQAVVGDMHGLNTLRTPAGQDRGPRRPLAERREANPCRCCCSAYPTWKPKPPATPSASRAWAAWILTHSLDGQIKGLKEFRARGPAEFPDRVLELPRDGRPGPADDRAGRLEPVAAARRAPVRAAPVPALRGTWMGPAGLVAVLAGWITTEVGRQPWVVYGVLRTADAVSKHGARRWPVAGPVRGGPICSCSASASPTCCGWCARGRKPSTRTARPRAGRARAHAGAAAVGARAKTTPPPNRGRTSMDIDMTAIWAAIIFFSVFMYVVLDGFDLGIGMLFPSCKDGASATP